MLCNRGFAKKSAPAFVGVQDFFGHVREGVSERTGGRTGVLFGRSIKSIGQMPVRGAGSSTLYRTRRRLFPGSFDAGPDRRDTSPEYSG